MNTKDFLRLGVPLGEATRRATDFVAKFILGGGDKALWTAPAERSADGALARTRDLRARGSRR